MTPLHTRIIAALSSPMTFAQVEAAVGRQEPQELGLALAELVLAGKVKRREPVQNHLGWPVYFVGRIPKGFVNPPRRKNHGAGYAIVVDGAAAL